MADHHPEIIIIKRRAHHEEEHHGGAWKIAFADFMTAMMAFFLVLWIINATDKNTKTMIARYFNPVKMEEAARTPKNIRSDGPAPAIDSPEYKNPHPTDPSAPETKNPTPDSYPPPGKVGDKPDQGGANSSTEPSDPLNPKPTMSEGVFFNDPYRSLDAIAGPASPDLQGDERPERRGRRRFPRSVPPDGTRSAERRADGGRKAGAKNRLRANGAADPRGRRQGRGRSEPAGRCGDARRRRRAKGARDDSGAIAKGSGDADRSLRRSARRPGH